MSGNIGTSMIITKGLHIEPSTRATMLGFITSYFSLYLETEETPPPQPPVVSTGGGGGPYPGPAWNKVSNIQTFYKPLDPEMRLLSKYEVDRLRPRTIVTLRFKVGNHQVEKIFSVTKRFEGQTVKIFHICNLAVNKGRVAIQKLRNSHDKLRAWITNLRNS